MNDSATYRPLDLDNWNRKEHFEFFSAMEEPFFGVTVQLDLTKAYAYCKSKGYSLSLYYLYAAAWASNAVESFSYRIIDNMPVVFDTIHLNAVQLKEDQSFVFTYMPFADNYEDFLKGALPEREAALLRPGLGITEDTKRLDSIHYSVLPWLDFSSLSHARSFSFPDSCPKISFGKMVSESDRLRIPCAIHVHHGLMDGFHVGQLVDKIQEFLNQNGSLKPDGL
ncbi:chloramphenicol acetyltransferase [Gilvibacter sediminis]|uniref:chloramphenicol acetyltransferase n=1 Tax=Gilvibacter sediminis TaxID=379071 RepID=UPI00235105C3|nr:chloramphenicol acetyltransferase [Gilvibacter sediminis]MDC7998136.1 chloramphenicol acetyltransferase [Gilvibacter sediminis]